MYFNSSTKTDISNDLAKKNCPPERHCGGTHEGGSFNITSACISLPQARHSGVPKGQ